MTPRNKNNLSAVKILSPKHGESPFGKTAIAGSGSTLHNHNNFSAIKISSPDESILEITRESDLKNYFPNKTMKLVSNHSPEEETLKLNQTNQGSA